MSYATVHSCTLAGVNAVAVIVEVHIAGGLPGMSIVGLPQSAVRESKDRVKAAIQHMGLNFPQVKIIVNLAPADLPKRGGRFDLPIALGILQATGQLPDKALDRLMVLGELGLTGKLRSVSGILPTSYAFADSPYSLFIPSVNAQEALRSQRTRVHTAESLQQAVQLLRNRHRRSLPLLQASGTVLLPSGLIDGTAQRTAQRCGQVLNQHSVPDMSDVFGQHKARRALEIAAAGGHNLILSGPPGTGKSMLASRLPGIQPPMTESEAMETASIASISYFGFDENSWGVRPFRAPHHTASGVALVGGGAYPMPGEISLAHHGVLFLDELPEYSRAVLDVLREPMETGRITVSRAARQAEFPSRFQLVAAMNPCPCGYHNDPTVRCSCTPDMIMRYQSRVSGPFLDRIDLHLDMRREMLSAMDAQSVAENEDSCTVRQRVVQARKFQLARQQQINAAITPAALRRLVRLHAEAANLLQTASSRLNLSLRAQHSLLRVARTIADLDGQTVVTQMHLAESLSYRRAPLLEH